MSIGGWAHPDLLPFAADGWLCGVRAMPSPNFDARPAGVSADLIVIHAISLPPGEFGGGHIADLFLNRLDSTSHPFFAEIEGLRVSAHFLVRRDSEIIQFVSCNDRAWHAGVSSWLGRERCNDFSIGIELEGADDSPFEDAQYTALAALCGAIARGYPIRHVAGHNHVAPSRKTDPGPCFAWDRLHESLSMAGFIDGLRA